MRKFIVLAIVLGLFGCKMNVSTETYTSDIRAISAGKMKEAKASGTITVNIPSAKKCDEYTTKIMNIMAGIVQGFSPNGCKREGMDSYLMLKGNFPVTSSEAARKIASSLFSIQVFTKNNNIFTWLILDKEKFKILNDRMDNEFHQGINIAESKIQVVLNNDERKDANVALNGVFYGGTPIYGVKHKARTLMSRERADIVLSNVGAASMAKQGAVLVFVLLEKQS